MRRFFPTRAATATHSMSFWFALLAAFSLAGPLPSARADITWFGDIAPPNPPSWDYYTTGYVGCTGTGTVVVDGGSGLLSAYCYLGCDRGAAGTVTVDGAGSTWNNSLGDLYVGNSGSGTLNIYNGGFVSVASDTYVGMNAGSTGTINFGSNGGTLSTQSLLAAPSQLAGTGTISARGLVSDIDLVFDAAHSLRQTVLLNSPPGRNISINLDMTGASGSFGALGAGWNDAGSLTIQDGLLVTSAYGYLGYHSGASGTATVDGPGST